MGRRLVYGMVLTVVLAVLWLALSGMWWHMIITSLGAASVAASVYMTARMGVLDGESVPFTNMIRFARYWAWLGGEIFKSNIAVVRLALAPNINIKPVLTRVAADHGTDLARTTFANSITLTPGTVTVEVEPGGFLVHALDESFADQEAFRDMERRAVRASDGEAPA